MTNSNLKNKITKKLQKSWNFKIIQNELISKGYEKKEVINNIQKTDEYLFWSSYQALYGLGLFLIIGFIVLFLLSPQEIFILSVTVTLGLIFLMLGYLGSKKYQFALIVAFIILSILILLDFVFGNDDLVLWIFGIFFKCYFLYKIAIGINPLKRIIQKK